jgi:ketosteroid isomerase-like protein
MKADAQVEREVLAVLDKAAEMYGRNRPDDARDLFSSADDITLISTGVDEEAIGWDQIKAGAQRDYEQTGSDYNEVIWKRRWVSARGDVAWVNAETAAKIEVEGRQMQVEGRLTAVLEKENGSWKIHTMHVSLPHPEQAPGQSWPRQR